MLPKAVANAMAVYENAWHDFLRRGFHLQVRPYKDNAACMTTGVSDSVLRAGIRAHTHQATKPVINNATSRWLAITRAPATNNDIRAQMGLPLFTPGVTVGVTEQEAA